MFVLLFFVVGYVIVISVNVKWVGVISCVILVNNVG